ncbi:MKI67 FHA domain-interacting nucleolar phosphoprotein-like [Nephila pilipes]|uniref:MKI67 FHA domain-interacting nucleolar phosphoprotein-like n=1 Tax=Nephila pilipes TaxID=299642 RepID=A0A8X6UD05_NEPPI|nr:MKI67 FHA domain-interacting nucleolar phosphoprotein-like [Nephila pilipes]
MYIISKIQLGPTFRFSKMMKHAFVERVRSKIKTPTKSDPDKPKKRKFKKKPKEEDCGPGVVYVGHIPHGFYEEEIKQYFSQFGKILRMRVARSQKTGNPKGYAFIEFEFESVAKIVAETMNNYLFFEKLLKCEFIPADKLHPTALKYKNGLFLSSDKNRSVQNRFKDVEAITKSKNRRIERLKKLQSFLKEKDIDFDVKSLIPQD